MGVVQSRTFRSGDAVAVELPDELAFGPDLAVVIERHGDTLTIRPAPDMADMADMADDTTRLQRLASQLRAIGPIGHVQDREPIEFPERQGL